MIKPENIDKIFTDGLEDYQIKPSPEVKNKIFVSSSAIKPQKPWYLSKGFLFLSSFLITSSIIASLVLLNSAESKSNGLLVYKNKDYLSISNTKSAVNPEIAINSKNKYAELKNKKGLSSAKKVKTDNPASNDDYKQYYSNQKGKNSIHQPLTTGNPSKYSQAKQAKSDKLLSQNITAKATQINGDQINKANTGTPESIQNKQPSSPSVSENYSITTEKTESTSNANYALPGKDKIEVSFANKSLSTTISDETHITLLTTKVSLLPSIPVSEIFNSQNGTPSYYQKGIWYIETSAGISLSNYKTSATDAEWRLASDAKQNMLKPSISNDFGLNIIYQRNRWQFKGGISYNSYGEKLSAAALLSDPHQETTVTYNGSYYEALINGIYYDIDSNSYYHYTYSQTNHIFVSDSTLAWESHYRPVDVTDTNNITRFDTIPKTTFYNKISYVELPLGVGYSFPQRHFNFILFANIIPGYFVSVKGMQIDTQNYPALENYSKTTIKKFTLSTEVGLEIEYSLNETWNIGLEPFYKKALFNIYSNDYNIFQCNNNYGFRISIRKML